jgi:hypothetical protein
MPVDCEESSFSMKGIWLVRTVSDFFSSQSRNSSRMRVERPCLAARICLTPRLSCIKFKRGSDNSLHRIIHLAIVVRSRSISTLWKIFSWRASGKRSSYFWIVMYARSSGEAKLFGIGSGARVTSTIFVSQHGHLYLRTISILTRAFAGTMTSFSTRSSLIFSRSTSWTLHFY